MEQIRVKAQITVLASLIFVLVLSVVCASVRACVDSITETIGNEAANLAVEAAFSNYTRPLADKYKILLLPSSEALEPYILDVARQNCSGIHTFGQIAAESVELDTIRHATDNGGHYFAMEVSDYMKYGVFSEIARKMMGMEEQLQKDTKAKELVEELTALEEDVIEVDSTILSLVQAVDGIETDESHIIGRGG